MSESNLNDKENQTYDAQVAELAADMSDNDDMSDDQDNEFLFPSIEPHYRNDSK